MIETWLWECDHGCRRQSAMPEGMRCCTHNSVYQKVTGSRVDWRTAGDSRDTPLCVSKADNEP